MNYHIRMYIDIFQSVDSLILLRMQSLVEISTKINIQEWREQLSVCACTIASVRRTTLRPTRCCKQRGLFAMQCVWVYHICMQLVFCTTCMLFMLVVVMLTLPTCNKFFKYIEFYFQMLLKLQNMICLQNFEKNQCLKRPGPKHTSVEEKRQFHPYEYMLHNVSVCGLDALISSSSQDKEARKVPSRLESRERNPKRRLSSPAFSFISPGRVLHQFNISSRHSVDNSLIEDTRCIQFFPPPYMPVAGRTESLLSRGQHLSAPSP